MRLEQWYITFLPGLPHVAPENKMCLAGNVFGHPEILDGSSITTNKLTFVSDTTITTKSGSVYELGEVDPKYEAHYPMAQYRLKEQAKRHGVFIGATSSL